MDHPLRSGCVRATFYAALVAAFLGSPIARAAQDVPDGATIRRIEFLGLERVSEDFVRRLIKSQEGQPYRRAEVQEDTNELLRSRKFLVVQAEPRLQNGEVVVLFELREKPTVASVSIVGNQSFGTDELLKELDFQAGSPLDEYLVNRGRDDLLRKYREGGYSNVLIEVDRDRMRSSNEVVYTITEGQKVRVRDVRIEGNVTYSRGELRPKITTQTYLWPFRTGAFDEEQATRDAVELQRFYRSEGFLDAKAGYRLEFDQADRSELAVVFVIEEGPRYRVDRVDIEGSRVVDPDTLRVLLQTIPGEWLNVEKIEQDSRRIERHYGEIGYVETRCAPDFVYGKAAGVVVVKFTIAETELAKYGRIVIRGNTRTKDEVIRRELNFFPEQPWNTAETAKAERRLRETTLFSRATITPLPPEAGLRDALVEVEERDAVNILFGVGVSTDNGLLGSVTIDNRNFDLFDWPRSFEEFVRGQSFRGDGQRLQVRLEPGTELSRFRIDFTEPYLFDKKIRFDWSAYLFQREREGYNEERLGMLVGLSKRIEGGWLDKWAVEGTLRIENVEVSDIDALAPSDVREVRGDSYMSSFRFGLVKDTTDSRLLPTEGYRFNISYEQIGILGGEYTFGRPSTGITWYKTLSTDAFERKSVLALRADASWIVGDAPVFDRFYGGGFGSIRGFNFRGVSPRKGVLDTPVGGEFVLLTGAEYSFPLYSDTVRGVTFLDMGTVEEDFEITEWRASVGFGLRVNVDFFGPVPMVFDFGFPIASSDEDDEQVFNFTFGASF